MNNIVTNIKALKDETLLNLKSSKANNTIRAYKSDFNDFGLCYNCKITYWQTSW